MPQQRHVVIALAVVWGAFATWIFWWLFVSVCCGLLFAASEPAIRALLHNGWTAQQIKPYLNGATTVLPALFYGLIFGFPLGLLPNRSVIATWATFVAAFLVTLAVRIWLVHMTLEDLKDLIWSIYPLTFLSTLLFAVLAHRARLAYANRRAAA